MLDPNEPVPVTLTVNGTAETARTTPRTTLADFLRHELGLTGTHVGCEQGVCGACTVRVDGAAVRSCLTLAVQVDGSTVDTVEGLAGSAAVLHPLQQKFWENQALQCGFCTPGFLMAAIAALEEEPDLDRAGIRDRLSGNLCRCTGYAPIVDAVAEYAEQRREAGA